MIGVILAIFVIWLYVVINCRPNNIPPGPHGFAAFPLFYRLSQENPLTNSGKLLRKYGDIVSLHINHVKTLVFLGRHDLVKEAFNKPEISDRAQNGVVKGLLNSNGHLWKEQRRFALTTLRDFGMGKNSQEESVIHECENLVQKFKKNNGVPFDPKFYISCATTNVICSMIFSERFEYGDPFLQSVHDAISQNVIQSRSYLTDLNFITKWMNRTRMEKYLKNRQFIATLIRKYIREHQISYREGNIRDYIDAYIDIMKLEQGRKDTTFTEEQLVFSAQDLFVAGSETTGTTIYWALALMALHPDIQRRVHQEIDQMIGHDRMPNISDKINMPFIEAVLLEIQRFGTIAPIVAHSTNADTTIGGYDIPKGSLVFADILSLNRDKRIWKNSDKFDISHFYNDNGEVINRNYFIAFSIGRRSCIGEGLAKVETFLFFVALMQKFWFEIPEGIKNGQEPDLVNVKSGIIRPPPPYLILCKCQ